MPKPEPPIPDLVAAGPRNAAASTAKLSAEAAGSVGASERAATTSSVDLLLNPTGGVTARQPQATSGLDSNGALVLNGAPAIHEGAPATPVAVAARSKAPVNPGDISVATAGLSIAAATVPHKSIPGQQTAAPSSVSSVIAQIQPAPSIASAHAGTSAALPNASAGVRSPQPAISPAATFAAMDRADANPGGALLHASTNQVAVGVSDPSLGWIEVRAERVAGQMTAALTTSSPATHAELTAALPAMSSYLNDHRQAVHHIQVETGLVSGQNSASSQQHSSGGHRQSAMNEPVDAISGTGSESRSGSTQAVQRVSHVPEATPPRTKSEGHQFSVRA